jgi:hypothetical protein
LIGQDKFLHVGRQFVNGTVSKFGFRKHIGILTHRVPQRDYFYNGVGFNLSACFGGVIYFSTT